MNIYEVLSTEKKEIESFEELENQDLKQKQKNE